MNKSKRIYPVLASALLALAAAMQPILADQQDDTPSRDVYVVYDNSGSMYELDNKQGLTDAWCKAKYSMEVFAGMLSDQDRMNVYYMSDYDTKPGADPRIELDGADDVKENIAVIHNTKTDSGHTSFDSVRTAMEDLEDSTADEKWLVILTDGKMQNYGDGAYPSLSAKQIEDYLDEKSEDIAVIFLGMGPQAVAIESDPTQKIFYRKTESSKDILEGVTEVGLQVFNANRLDVDKRKQTVSFDVPMKELRVFAQGENVQINGIVDENDKTYKPDSDPVEVRYSEVDSPSHPENKPDTSLQGQMALFTGPFEPGQMKLDVDNASTIEVYYKPDVDIAVTLLDESGKEVTSLESLKGGEYTLSFGLINAMTNEPIEKTDLLGDVSYEAKVTNNGKDLSGIYGNNDQIQLEEGDLSIDVLAHYLDYNTAHTRSDYSVMTDKTITWELTRDPEYVIKGKELRSANTDLVPAEDPIELQALVDGKKPTAEQWSTMELPVVSLKAGTEDKLEDFCVEKTETPGLYTIYPQLPESGPMKGKKYEPAAYTIAYSQKVGPATWQGSAEETLKLNDSRNWFARNPWFWWIPIGAALAAILFGYYWKGRLPKSLKDNPQVTVKDNQNYGQSTIEYGRTTRDKVSKWMPYMAEKASIQLLPSTAGLKRTIDVKAIRGDTKMKVLNQSVLKDGKIQDKTIEDYMSKGKKRSSKNKKESKNEDLLQIKVSDSIKFENDGKTYTTQLNKGKDEKGKARGGKGGKAGRGSGSSRGRSNRGSSRQSSSRGSSGRSSSGRSSSNRGSRGHKR